MFKEELSDNFIVPIKNDRNSHSLNLKTISPI